MDIYVRLQETAAINIIVGLGINTGAPDTGATLTVKAINPDGTENTTFTQPTISEVIASSGVYKLIFPTNAATKLFTQADENNPYTLLIKTATSGSTWYRAIRVYCVSKLPVDYAAASALTTVDGIVDDIKAEVLTHPTLAEIEASTVLAKEASITTIDANVDTLVTNLATVDGLVDGLVTSVAGLALASDMAFLLDVIKNKKEVRKETATWYLCVRNDSDSADILKKALKDSSGADITDLTAGMIASELATSI